VQGRKKRKLACLCGSGGDQLRASQGFLRMARSKALARQKFFAGERRAGAPRSIRARCHRWEDYMGVSLEKWRKLPTGLTSHFRLFHVAYDSLPTVIDVDVLDANVLLPTVTKPSKHLDLGRIGSQ